MGEGAIGMSQEQKKPKRSCPFCGGHDIEIYEHYGTAVGIDYGGFFPSVQNAVAG